ncbi:MAG: disulfide isomerase DsbC N-terminal domain-containing protein [Syntrophales bacterium]
MKRPACLGKLVPGFIILLFLSTMSSPACADNGKECVDIAKDKITSTLKKMNAPTAEIVAVKKSPLDGICEIRVNIKGSAVVFYADPAFNHVIIGNMHDTRTMANLTAASVLELQDQKRIDLAKITVNEAMAIGQKGATKKVIVFSDPD